MSAVDEYLELCVKYQQSPETNSRGYVILGVHREALIALDKQRNTDVKIQRREPIGFTIKTNGNFILANSFEDEAKAKLVKQQLDVRYPLDVREIVPLYTEL